MRGRTVATPPGFASVYRPSPETVLGPFVYDKSNGYQFDLSWVAGEFGLRASGILYADTRYILRVRYNATLNPTQHAEPAVLRAVVGNASGGVISRLPDHMIVDGGGGEALWVLESGRDYPTVGIEVFVAIRWAAYEGYVTLRSIELMVAPVGYGEDAVVRF